MSAVFRTAELADVTAMFDVRTSVRENHLPRERLAGMGITHASISDMIASSRCAWVAIVEDEVVGFSMIDMAEASLFAAFVLPSHEGRGIGSQLVRVAERELFQHHPKIWLETDKDSRAAGFYRHLGWSDELTKGGQVRLTKPRP